MKDLFKIIMGRKLPAKKVKEIKDKLLFHKITDDIFNDMITYHFGTNNTIFITEDKTKILDRRKWITEHTTIMKKYNSDGLLISNELVVTSNYSNDIIRHKLTSYNPAGSLRGKIEEEFEQIK